MDLYCLEPAQGLECKAYTDPNILNDDRVLKNLLDREERYITSSSYFQCLQKDLTPHMRKIIAEWLLEICEEEKCQEEVFLLAINYMDRFLNVCPIKRTQLQLLATTCLLLSSKLRETRPIPAETLVTYTQDDVKVEELWMWEMLVLSKLKWDIAAVTPQDFLSHIYRRLPLNLDPLIDVHMERVHEHAKTFIALCARDHKFTMFTASMIAGASVAAALHGLDWTTRSSCSLSELLDRLHKILSIDTDILHSCLDQIEQIMAVIMSTSNTSTESSPNSSSTATSNTLQQSNTAGSSLTSNNGNENVEESDKSMTHSKAGTPTDVHDVHF